MMSNSTLTVINSTFSGNSLGVAGTGSTNGTTAGSNMYLLEGAFVNLPLSSPYTISGAIAGSGGLVISGTSTLTLSGSSTYSGSTTLNGGTLTVSASNVFSPNSTLFLANASGVFFNLNGNDQSIGSLSGGGNLGGNILLGSGTLTIASNSDVITRTYSGVISGSGGSINKENVGTLVLAGINTYSGTTTISNGILAFSGDTSQLRGNIVDNTLLEFTQTADSSFSGSISGIGTVLLQSSNTLTLFGTNTYSEQTLILTGTLQAGVVGAFSPTSRFTLSNASNAFLDLNNYNQTIASLSGGGILGGNVSLGSGTLTLGGNNRSTSYAGIISGSGGLVKQGTGTFSLSGTNIYSGSTTINGGGIQALANNAFSPNSAIFITNTAGVVLDLNNFNETIGSLSGGGSVGGDVHLGLGTLTLGSDNTSSTYSGVIRGTGGLVKQGTGSFVLTRANTYQGMTTISSGTLIFSGDTSLLGGNVVDQGALIFTQAANSSFSGEISGTGTVTLNGSATLVFFGINSYSGATTINSGTLQAGINYAFSPTSAVVMANSAGSALDLNTSYEIIGSLSGGGAAGGNVFLGGTLSSLTLGGDNKSTTYSGVISGGGVLIKEGRGNFVLTGTNTYAGTTTINGGTLTLCGNTSLLEGNIVDNAALVFNQSNDSSYSGLISGPGTVTQSGSGTLTFFGTNTYTGITTISSGTLIFIQDTSSLTGNMIDNGALVFDQTQNSTFSGVISGSGSVAQNGIATLTLPGINTYSGTTTISSGVLIFSADTSQLSGNMIDNGSLIFNQSDNSIFSGEISGIGIVTQSGSAALTLSGANIYSGTTTISSGSLILSGDTSGLGGNIIDGGALIFDQSVNSTFAGLISGPGPVSQNGSTTLNLSGNNTYNGTTTISSGTLVFLGDTSGLAGNIVDNGSLVFDQTTNTTFSGAITGIGTLNQAGVNVLTLTGSRNTYSGTTTVTSGTLQAGVVYAFSPFSPIVMGNTVGAGLNLNGFNESIPSLSGGGILGGNVVLASATLTLGGDNPSTTYSGVISGSGLLVKQGRGNFTLTGANTYSATTTILSGTITFIGDTSGLSGGISNSSALVFAQLSDSSIAGVISGTGTVTQAGNTNLTFLGDNTYSGNTSILSGTLTFTGSTSGLTGNIFDDSALVFSPATNSSYFGVISGTGTVTKNGSARLTLFGANSYSGNTYVDGGSLQAGASGVFSSNSAVIMDTAVGVTLDLNGFDQTIASLAGGGNAGGNVTLGVGKLTLGRNNKSTLFSGGISGLGSLSKEGTGTFTLSGVNNTYSGTTTVHQGVLQAGGVDAFSSSSAVVLDNTPGVSLDLNNFSQTIASLSGGGTAGGNVTLGSATLTFGENDKSTTYSGNITGTGGIAKQGIGTFKVSGVNSYSGVTAINGGILQAGATNAFSSTSAVVIANDFGTKLDLNNFNETIGSLSGGGASGGNVNLGSGVLTLAGDNTSTTYFGAISGAGGIVKEGSGVFTLGGGNNTYFGSTVLNQGTLETGVTNALSPNSTVVMGTSVGALLDLNNFSQIIGGLAGGSAVGGYVSLGTADLTLGGNNQSTTYSGVIEGGGQVTKIGTGTFTLAGANLFTGAITVADGTLNLSGSLSGNAIIDAFARIKGTGTVGGNLIVNNQGIVSPGNSIGTLHVGSYTNNGGIYEVEINGTGQSDLIECSGNAVINGGTVVVTSVDGIYDLAYKYVIVSAENVTGTYSNAVSTSSLISPILLYDPQHVYLLVDINFVSAARTCNQIAVANELDTIIYPNAYEKPLLNALLTMTSENIQQVLDQLSGQQYTNDFFSTQEINRDFIRRLYDPIRYIVTKKPLKQSFYHPCYGAEFDTNHNKFDVWIESGAGCTHVYNAKGARGFHLNGYEVTFGIQREIAPNWTIGLAGSYESDDILYNYYGRGKSKTLLGGLYALYRPQNYYLLADFAYGFSKNSTKRSVTSDTLFYEMYSHPRIAQSTFYGEVGVDYAYKNYMVQPFAGLEVAIYNRQRVAETGGSAWNLVINKNEKATVNTRLGVHLTANKLPYKSSINLDLAWNKRLTDSNASISEKFLNFGNVFTIKGVDVDRSSLECDITASTCCLRGWRFYIEGNAEVWNLAYNLNILGGVEFTW